MDYRSTEVYKYFLSLDTYVLGDLKLFHNLSKEAEKLEQLQDETTKSVRTPEEFRGTRYPYDFDFNFGKPQPCRATIPFSLMIFSCMDIIGYLVNGKNHTATEQNILAFYKYVDPIPPKDELKCLVRIFRHGLAHNYFPKLGQALTYHSTNPDKLFFKNRQGIVYLNVNKLESNFLEAYEKIKKDESLYVTMNKNFEDLNNHYEQNEKCTLLTL